MVAILSSKNPSDSNKGSYKYFWCRLKQKHFLGRAARDGSRRSVHYAFRFVEILPRMYTSLATYNMLITVCIQAKDLPAAMQALDLLRANGYKPDSILYNNLITGKQNLSSYSFIHSLSIDQSKHHYQLLSSL